MTLDLLLGTWVNTNASSKWISRVILKPHDGTLKALFVCEAAEWGEIEAPVFGEQPGDNTAAAFHARHRSGALDVRLQGYVVKGVLVVISFARTEYPSPLPAFMVKEFFYRVEDR